MRVIVTITVIEGHQDTARFAQVHAPNHIVKGQDVAVVAKKAYLFGKPFSCCAKQSPVQGTNDRIPDPMIVEYQKATPPGEGAKCSGPDEWA